MESQSAKNGELRFSRAEEKSCHGHYFQVYAGFWRNEYKKDFSERSRLFRSKRA